eukprot:5599673-Karenia_brevis.AAC.1
MMMMMMMMMINTEHFKVEMLESAHFAACTATCEGTQFNSQGAPYAGTHFAGHVLPAHRYSAHHA